MNEPHRRCLVIGTGRAGGSFERALSGAGWSVRSFPARRLLGGADVADLAAEAAAADLVLLAVADHAIALVAAALPASPAVYAHVSGATGLDVLEPHERVGSIHPLMSLPDTETGARRLRDHCTFAIDGDAFLHDVVRSLGGRAVEVAPSQRTLYHAAATIAANHLTALCAQVEDLASQVGVPVDAYWSMMRHTLDNVASDGAEAALTGPASRADWATIRAHVRALPSDADRQFYLACCSAAARLAGYSVPADLGDG